MGGKVGGGEALFIKKGRGEGEACHRGRICIFAIKKVDLHFSFFNSSSTRLTGFSYTS